MFAITRRTALAFAAVMALGSMALVSNDASAKPGFGGGFKGPGYSKFGGGGFKGGGYKLGQKGNFYKPGFIKPGFGHHYHHPHWRYVRRPWIAPVVATGVATGHVATAPRTNCLTKEYTPQGAVLFRDVCTNEWAMNPTTPAPTSYDPSQLPSLQSSAVMPQQMSMPMQQPAPLPGLQTR